MTKPKPPSALLRPLQRGDLADIWHVRYAVRENTLTPGRIGDAEVIERIEATGRGWGVEVDGRIIGFAIACTDSGGPNSGRIWALFVHPDHADQGHGARLHDAMVDHLWAQGLQRLWLNTMPGSRAETFYRLRGWLQSGRSADGEIRFELPRPADFKPPTPSTS